jgi:SAM-dependent methyltransferase
MTTHPADAQLSQLAGRSAFGTDAAGYHAGRIGYPPELFEGLFARCVPHPEILEIGAGTGLATDGLWQCAPKSLTAIEPDAALVDFLRARFADHPLKTITSGFIEADVSGAYDLITCAAAFHWMDAATALAKITALLRPKGIWAMWWNSYLNPGIGDALADAIMPLLDGIALPPSVRRHGHYSLDVEHHYATLAEAGFVEIEHQIYRRERTMSAADVVALYASYSFVRALNEAERAKLLGRIESLVEHDFAGSAPNVVLTACYSAQRKPCMPNHLAAFGVK